MLSRFCLCNEKKMSTKTWSLPAVNEWTLPAETVVGLIKEICPLHAKILMLGAGYSSIGLLLFKAGFSNLVITDVCPDAILFQRSLILEEEESPQIELDDILHSKLPTKHFNFIFDGSVTDVFIRNKNNAKKVVNIYEQLLAPLGKILTISIFHKPWKRILNKKLWTTEYAVVPHFVRSKRRPSAGGIPHPRAVFIYQRKMEYKPFLVSLPMILLSSITTNDMTSGAEDM